MSNEPPEYTAAKAFPRQMGAIAGNDEDGSMWCGLCDWTTPPAEISMELVEHRIQAHLQAAHGVQALSRYDHSLKKDIALP